MKWIRSTFVFKSIAFFWRKMISPKVQIVKNEILLFYQSKIFNAIMFFPLMYFGFGFYKYAKSKFYEKKDDKTEGYPSNHPV
jgi:hypothetical protein